MRRSFIPSTGRWANWPPDQQRRSVRHLRRHFAGRNVFALARKCSIFRIFLRTDPPMNENESLRMIRVLEELRDGQKLQLERQQEALQVQREQFALVQKQFERTERIQDRAEKLQAKSADIVGIARKTLLLIVPVVIALIAYVSWLIFRR